MHYNTPYLYLIYYNIYLINTGYTTYHCLVQDVMLIAGGKDSTTSFVETSKGYIKTLSVVMPDGNKCLETGLPELPKILEGFGMASRKDRYVFLCGGIRYSCGACGGK